MLYGLRGAGLLVLAACVVFPALADEKKDAKAEENKPGAKKDKDAPKPDEKKDARKDKADDSKDKLVVIGEITGKLSRVEGAQKYLAVQVSQVTVAPTTMASNPSALLQQQQAIMRNPNPLARRQQLLQLLQQMQGYQVQRITKDVELQAADDLKVRTLNPPAEFDDKGKPRRYTAKELQELRGSDTKLPGYQADFDSLKADQIVKVTIARKRDAVAKPMPKPKGKAKEKEADNEPTESEKPLVTLVLILQEPAGK